MPRVLITAFEPYDRWTENSSWLTLVELTKNLPAAPQVTTRRYPVDFATVKERLAQDLASQYDVALHLGQSPGSSRVHLESVGLNVGGRSQLLPEEFQPLVDDGPVAYRSTLPLSQWAKKLRAASIPAQVSYHAGTYLCNAVLYLTHHIAARQRLPTRATFIHLPLSPCQVLGERTDVPSLPVPAMAAAVGLILQELA